MRDLHLRLASSAGAALSAAAGTTESAAAVQFELGGHGVRVEAEQAGGLTRFTHRADRVVWHRDDADALVRADLYFAVHAGPQQALAVIERDQHRKHRDVLLHGGLRFNLLDSAAERAIRIRVDRDRRLLAGLHGADIRFVHERARAHFREIGHRRDDGAAVDGRAAGLNDLSERDGLRNDRAANGCIHRRVGEALAGEFVGRGRAYE